MGALPFGQKVLGAGKIDLQVIDPRLIFCYQFGLNVMKFAPRIVKFSPNQVSLTPSAVKLRAESAEFAPNGLAFMVRRKQVTPRMLSDTFGYA